MLVEPGEIFRAKSRIFALDYQSHASMSINQNEFITIVKYNFCELTFLSNGKILIKYVALEDFEEIFEVID